MPVPNDLLRFLTRTGFAYHGDFMMGWESEEFLQQAVDTCTNPSGKQSDCALFQIVPEVETQQCKMKTPADLVNDNVLGPVKDLPGGVAVGGQIERPISSVTYSPGSTPTGTQYLPGQVFHPSETPAAAPVQNAPPAPTYEAVSTQVVQAANIVTEVVWEQAIEYVTQEVDVVTTVTVPVKARRAEGHMRRHQRHGHGL